MKTKYTRELLEPAIKQVKSFNGLIRLLGIKITGGTHNHLKRIVIFHGIDIQHFTGRAHNFHITSKIRKHWSEILVVRSDGIRTPAWLLRRALIESGRVYECEICKLGPVWNGKELRLTVDHKDRNWQDSRPENVRFACPNCHAQTPGFSGSKGKTGVTNKWKVKPTTFIDGIQQPPVLETYKPTTIKNAYYAKTVSLPKLHIVGNAVI